MSSRLVSVIIPAYRETAALANILSSLKGRENLEIIVSIPYGDEISKESAKPFLPYIKIVEGEAGRGSQLHSGALLASGDILIFCHADTLLPDSWEEMVARAIKDGAVGGAFRLRFGSDRFVFRIIELFAGIRAYVLGYVYGDQAIFAESNAYHSAGGFEPLPIMEDLDFFKRLKRHGKVTILDVEVITSARRYEKSGIIAGVLRNTVIAFLYFLGVSPGRIAGQRAAGRNSRTR